MSLQTCICSLILVNWYKGMQGCSIYSFKQSAIAFYSYSTQFSNNSTKCQVSNLQTLFGVHELAIAISHKIIREIV
ncbi:MAG: hypothetical protein V7L04_12575 [Nostoc sp.]|uniref:hypothetical protein n=1 Tax=Nostoc sp. TaxID=1180 RepID=UPI002FF73616